MKETPRPKNALPTTGKEILNLFKSKEKQSAILNGHPPSNDTESGLFAIWAELLAHKNFGVGDDFFQVGGNSLKAIQLLSRVTRQFQITIEITDIFLKPTIAELAVFIREQQKNNSSIQSLGTQLRSELAPLSFSQERLWFIDQLEGSVQYHLPAVLRLRGKLDRKALEHTLQTIVNRHEVLRTVFLHQEGQTWQKIKDKNGFHLSVISGVEYANNPQGLLQFIHKIIGEPFDLSKDNMLRASLITLGDQEHVVVLTMHHIASDGWSISVLVKEVIELYNAYIENRPPDLLELPIQYADFSIWQRQFLQGEVLNQKMKYWKEKLAEVAPLELATDFQRPAVWSSRGAMTPFSIGKELSEKLQLISQQHGATLFMTLLAALKVLLHRYTGQQDICVGTGIAGRQQQEVENLMGFFVNTLAIRSDVSADKSFTEFLHQVKATTLGAYQNQEAPFEKVVEAVVSQRDMSRNPLFQVMLVLQNTPTVPELLLGDVQLSREPYEHSTAQFDLSFSISETDSGLQGELEYSTDLFKPETIDQMLRHFLQLLQSITKEPQQLIGSLPMLSDAETKHVLFEFNNSSSEYPVDKSIIDLFEEQVLRTPGNKALVFETEQVCYQELNERSNQLAHYLVSKDVKPGMLVPICVDRSINMIVGILGILKTGAVYVPIDPKYPSERINYMLFDTAATVAVCTTGCKEKLVGSSIVNIIDLDDDCPVICQQSTHNLNIKITPDQLVYIIYTSGSTGTPKGVMIEHRNVVSLVKGVEYVSFDTVDVLLSTGSFSFDATTFEYWGMLLNGGLLVVCPESTLLNSALLKKEINQWGVTKMWFTSSWFNQLVETDITLFERLQTILVGGEKLSEQHIKVLRQTYPGISIINGYGPTENTTFSLTYKIEQVQQGKIIPIGRPLSNRTAFILNQNNQPVSIGVVGEIYLGGAGLARGYLNRPELTEQKFIVNSFSEDFSTRLYKTGDLGRWLPDGNIQFLGRADDQVKIRGYRIELGEIESVLQESDLVRQAVVLVKENAQKDKVLVGYIVPQKNFSREAIISHLREKLPEYMIPALWVDLEFLPLTNNGKVDKKALPDPNASELSSNAYIAPTTETEKVISNIWKDLLGLTRVGITDNFFEVGGHSLLAMRLISAIRNELGLDLTIKELFACPTIALLSAHLVNQNRRPLLSSIKAEKRPDLIPLSFSQERLWFIDLLEGSVQYHLPIVLRLKGSLNIKALTNALNYVINRHESLRTVI
ncbi:MAG: amino acid adenylation domain-containing protein, partial [Flavitalea sp.]